MGKYSDALLSGEPTQDLPARGKYSTMMLGDDQSAADEPQSWMTWIAGLPGRAVAAAKGEHDAAFAGVEAGPRVGQQHRDLLQGAMSAASLFGASDDAMADIVEKNLGDRFIRREKDANGYHVFVTKDPDGQELKGYLNKPGLDTQDVGRGLFGAAPYLAGGGVAAAAAKGGGLAVNAGAQAVSGALTSVAGDAGSMAQGSEQGIDPVKAFVMGGLGAASPVIGAGIGAAWRQIVTIPGLVDRTTGQLTAKGLDAAKSAGLDPADVTPDMAKSFAAYFARSGDADAAAAHAGFDKFGIRATRGQITKDKEFLHQEESMRWGHLGESAKQKMLQFDKEQQDAIRFAALGGEKPPNAGIFAPPKGIAEGVNRGRQPGLHAVDRQPATLGDGAKDGLQAAREAARKQDADLWDDTVTSLKPTPEAKAMMPSIINPKLADVSIDELNTPAAHSIRDILTKFVRGEAPEPVDTMFRSAPIDTVDQLRRRVGGMVEGAKTGQDKKAARALYDGVNDWITEAANQKLLLGDAIGAANLIKARGFHRDVMAIFEPKSKSGQLTAAGQRLTKVLDGGKADSGEGVIDALLGSQGSRKVSDGVVGAMENIKTALQTYAPGDVAEQAWNDIRLAYFLRQVSGKTGDLVGPMAMASNLKTAFHSQSTLMQKLFTPQEMSQMRQFEKALSNISYRPPNASGTSYGNASYVSMMFKKVLGFMMKNDAVAGAAALAGEKLGLKGAYGAIASRNAVKSGPRAVDPNLAPVMTGVGQDAYNNQ